MDGYIVCFIRRDNKPDENYFYHTLKEAEEHLNLFKNDDSGLYRRIEVQNTNDNVRRLLSLDFDQLFRQFYLVSVIGVTKSKPPDIDFIKNFWYNIDVRK